MAGFNPSPLDGSTPQIPMSSAVVPGDKTPHPVQGTRTFTDSQGNVLSDLATTVLNTNPNGQNTMVNSSPVTLASDQPGLSQMANSDGLALVKVLAEALYAYTSGGPVDSTGKPQQATFDRIRTWQGKATGGAASNITATLVSDTSLTFSVAPKTIMPGQAIQLSVGTGNVVETVYVSTGYTPSSTATSIPLQFPVVNAGNTTAQWDVYAPGGPGLNPVLDTGLLPVVLLGRGASANLFNALVTADVDNESGRLILLTQQGVFNGTNVDRARGNLDVQLLASAARTTTQTSADIVNYNGRGIRVRLAITSIGTGSVTLSINEKDPGGGGYTTLLTTGAVITGITARCTIYPGVTPASTSPTWAVSDILPRTFQIVVTANNANSVTYSVGYSIIL